jgi:hypothetical protein
MASAAAAKVATSFGLGHHAFGTKVDGNPVARSGATANSVLGCTNLAGLLRRNHVADVSVPGAVTASEVHSVGTTTKRNGVVTVTSRNTISSGSLGTDVRFRGLSSESRTWHDDKGFHNRVTFDLTRLTIGGDPVALSGRQQRFDVPGVGTLTAFDSSTTSKASGASARGLALRLRLDDGTRVQVGSSYSRMLDRVFGPMGGSTWGSQVEAADGSASTGRSAFQVMPCQGTQGVVRENTTAGETLPGVLATSEVTTHVRGVQEPARQRGYTQAEIARARLGDAGFVARGISSQANVQRDSSGLTRNANGTRLLSLSSTATGDVSELLVPGEAVPIAGLGMVTFKDVDLVRNGIEVVALEVVLPDNTVIELGHSTMRIAQN